MSSFVHNSGCSSSSTLRLSAGVLPRLLLRDVCFTRFRASRTGACDNAWLSLPAQLKQPHAELKGTFAAFVLASSKLDAKQLASILTVATMGPCVLGFLTKAVCATMPSSEQHAIRTICIMTCFSVCKVGQRVCRPPRGPGQPDASLIQGADAPACRSTL